MAIELPEGLKPYFQEYDPDDLDLTRDAELILQRTLEFGTWDEVRWLFKVYGAKRIRTFLRQKGERWLRPVVFNYWRKLLGIRQWKRSPFPISKGELWKL
jgi:squalene cyclase